MTDCNITMIEKYEKTSRSTLAEAEAINTWNRRDDNE